MTCDSEEAQATRDFLTRVADKWSILIVVTLSRRPEHRARFSELLKAINGISDRMLTTTLRHLERDGMLEREVFPEVPPRVEYQLTRLGLGLLEPLQQLTEWVVVHWGAVKRSRTAFDNSRAKHAASSD